MCEPVSIITVATAVVGTAIAAKSASDQAKAARGQAAYAAGVARNNAIIADQQAESARAFAERSALDAEARGIAEEQRVRRQTAQLVGRQRAVLAANGVQVDAGSALDITTDSKAIGEIDALTVRSNAAREALGYREQGAQDAYALQLRGRGYESEAVLADYAGANAAAQGRSAVAGTLITGATSVASKWYDYSKVSGTSSYSSSDTAYRAALGSYDRQNANSARGF